MDEKLTSRQKDAARDLLLAGLLLGTANGHVRESLRTIRDDIKKNRPTLSLSGEQIVKLRKALMDLQSIASRMQRYTTILQPVDKDAMQGRMRRQIRLPQGEQE